jgi:hypothetical protein
VNDNFNNIPNKPLVDWDKFTSTTRFSYYYDSDGKTIELVNNSLEPDLNEYRDCVNVLMFCRKHISLLDGSSSGNYTTASLLNELTNARSASGASLAFLYAVEYFHPDTAERFFSDWRVKMEPSRLLAILSGKVTSSVINDEYLLASGFINDLQAVEHVYMGSPISMTLSGAPVVEIGQKLEALGNLPDRDYNFSAMFGFKTFFVDQPQENAVTKTTFIPLNERAYIDWPGLISELNLLLKRHNELKETFESLSISEAISKDSYFADNRYPGTMSENFIAFHTAITTSPEATRLFKDCFVSPAEGTINAAEMLRIFKTNRFRSIVFDLCAPSSALHFLPKGLRYDKDALERITHYRLLIGNGPDNRADSHFQPLVNAIGNLTVSYLGLGKKHQRLQVWCMMLSDDVQWPDGFKFLDILRHLLDGPTLGLFYSVVLRKAETEMELENLPKESTESSKALLPDGSVADTLHRVLTKLELELPDASIDYTAIINNRADVLMLQLRGLCDTTIAYPNNFSEVSIMIASECQFVRFNRMRLAYLTPQIGAFIAQEIGSLWEYRKTVGCDGSRLSKTFEQLLQIYRDFLVFSFINKVYGDQNDADAVIIKIDACLAGN